MPFTLAHPAAVLPLMRHPFMNATTSHSPLGAIIVDLPYALALCGFYWMARRPVRTLLPALATSEPPTPGSVSALLSHGSGCCCPC